MKKISAFFLCALLAGCSAPTVPDITYFHLAPTTTALTVADHPVFPLPLVVDIFSADGVYAEQALLYSSTTDGGSLRAYHYQLWSDPPAHLLQRRLIDQMRAVRMSDLIADRLTSNIESLRVSTLIRRFERVGDGNGWRCIVRLQFRVDRGASNTPLLIKDYSAEAPAGNATPAGAVQALSGAVDRIFAEFMSDLRGLKAD